MAFVTLRKGIDLQLITLVYGGAKSYCEAD